MELNIGSNIIRNTSGVLNVSGKEQISLEIGKDDQVLLTMDLYDQAGKNIAKLRRNAWGRSMTVIGSQLQQAQRT